MSQSITITQPDDWHVHFRDDAALQTTVAATAKHFARALVMPNLRPALTRLDDILAYRQRILTAVPPGNAFQPLMTFYLNEHLTLDAIHAATTHPFILGAKLYPAGVTTNAEAGARSIRALYPVLEAMQAANLVLQIHGEVNHDDIFEREGLFIESVLKPLSRDFPRLRMVLEHISTRAAVDFVREASDNIAATMTIHHLLYNRNHLLAGGIRPHFYCLPILKSAANQQALQQIALSGHPRFFAGTDSAPHDITQKQSGCGCAGIFSAPYALALYCQFFDDQQQLGKLQNFVSTFGADFYQQPHNEGQIQLIKQPCQVPEQLPFATGTVVPIAAGETLQWCAYDA